MRIRIIFLLIGSIPCYSSFGQKNNSCELLDALLKYGESKKVFYFDKHKEVPIVFIDVHEFFEGCIVNNYYGREIQFVHDSSQLEVVNYSNIVVSNFAQTSNGYKIALYYKIRNAFFRVEFKRKNNKIIVSKFSGGYF